MNEKQEQQYRVLVEFLGKALGPDYEITLHNFGRRQSTLSAIANGHISGREKGAPSTGFVQKILKAKQYEKNDYILSYRGRAVNNKILRCASLFIKNGSQKPVGMLCINFDDERYHELSKRLFSLCHPDPYIEQNIASTRLSPDAKTLPCVISYEETDMKSDFDGIIASAPEKYSIPPERLSIRDKREIAALLDTNGFFLSKGAIPYAAERLRCSVASIYRYLKNAKSGRPAL
jgi:predicted transcriptional regulator YheO